MEITPQRGQVYSQKVERYIDYYFPEYYYSLHSGPHEYSKRVVRSKTSDMSDFFWPYCKTTLELACRNSSFKFSCIIPNSDCQYSPTLISLQERIKAECGIEELNVLCKKPGCRKSTDLIDSDDRMENTTKHAAVIDDLRIRSNSLLMLDDVKTTGSHIIVYGSLLYLHGASYVAAILLAENY